MLNEKLMETILEEGIEFFKSFQTDGKILVWTNSCTTGMTHTVYELQDFLNDIKNRAKSMAEEIDEEDDEKLESLDYGQVFDYEFDNEYKGIKNYYDPIESLKDEDYKYCYLIIFNIHVNTPKQVLVSKVYSNKEIKNKSEMTDILNKLGKQVPGEFGIAWANHYFSELNEIDVEELYIFTDEFYKDKNKIDSVYVE